ncbi:MAG: alpha-2-macroglobulin family protein, partial [Burkholderiaceae bacterium]|nr:alpha-2-macroglobulin family protein [Burkholderiaceae bacterium]
MNRLHELVARGAAFVWRFVLMGLRFLGALFGSWHAPRWLGWLGEKLAPLGRLAQRYAAFTLLAVLVAVGALAAPKLAKVDWHGWYAAHFSAIHPDGQKTTAGVSVTPPGRTAIESDGKPQPVVLNFSASAAPLSRVGKEAQDVAISPAIAGKWLWSEANKLEFTPAADWPIAVEYTVTLGAKALAPHVDVDREVKFSSPRFAMTIGDPTFYQDPVQFTQRKAVFQVNFTQPVNPELFEKRVHIVPDSGAAGLFAHAGDEKKVTVTYDKFKLQATVISEPMAIPANTTSVSLSIDAGVMAQKGGNATEQTLTQALAIPGLYSLDIVDLKQVIVTGDSGEPENILQVTTGMPVQEKEMGRVTSAWLLPEKKDDSDEPWADPADVTPDVLKKAKHINLQTVPAERETTDTHTFKFTAEPGRFLFVRIAKGLKSAGGYELGATRDEIFRVKRSAPELAIMSKGSLLALSGDKKLPLVVRDLPGVRIELGRLLPQQLQHLVTQSQGDMTNPQFYSGITPDNLTERFEKKLPLSLKPGKTHYETVDFGEYLKADAADRRGIFLLTVQGYDPANANASDADQQPDQNMNNGDGEGEGEGEANADDEEKIDPTRMLERRLVIVTDLGIVSKTAIDGSRDVFVESIANGQSVAGATVEIWARNGAVLVSQATDAEGRAHLPSLTGFAREKAPVVLVVKKAGDLSFLPLNRDRTLDMSRFDVGGLHSSGLPNQIQAYLFSDRGIYRPGDTINIGMIAKSQGRAQKLADLPVEMEVTDARGLVIRREKLKLGPGGMAEFTQATEDTTPTG